MKTKHIKTYSSFLIEQAMPMGMEGGAPAPAPKVQEYFFIFMGGPDDTGVSKKKYPDGSTTINYPSYSITLPDLEKWVGDSLVSTEKDKITPAVLDLRKKNLVNIVKGDKVNISKDDAPFIEKLKQAVSSDILGKREPDLPVIYLSDGTPTTENIDCTFIKYAKK
jgi:hypothetical protein